MLSNFKSRCTISLLCKYAKAYKIDFIMIEHCNSVNGLLAEIESSNNYYKVPAFTYSIII